MDVNTKPSLELVERLREMILEDTGATAYVLNEASNSLAHIEKVYGKIADDRIRDELLCQYQVQAWNVLFKRIGDL